MEEKKKGFQDRLKSVVSATKEAVKDIDLSDIKEKISDIDIDKEDIKNKIAELKDKIPQKESGDQNTSEQPVDEGIKALSTECALKIIYYLMAADGQVFHSEEEKYDSMGKELSPNYSELKPVIVENCKKQLNKQIDSEDYFEILREGIEDAISTSIQTEDTFITPKLLVWDLLTIAYSDEQYSDIERKLVKHVVRKLDIDKAVFMEMESSILTLMDIEKELEWIKTTNKPYLTIEGIVNELNERKNVIFESVKDLIAL